MLINKFIWKSLKSTQQLLSQNSHPAHIAVLCLLKSGSRWDHQHRNNLLGCEIPFPEVRNRKRNESGLHRNPKRDFDLFISKYFFGQEYKMAFLQSLQCWDFCSMAKKDGTRNWYCLHEVSSHILFLKMQYQNKRKYKRNITECGVKIYTAAPRWCDVNEMRGKGDNIWRGTHLEAPGDFQEII